MDEDKKKISTRAEFESAIIKKAWQDPEYKARLIEHPKQVLEEEISAQLNREVKLPEKLEVSVHEESPFSVHLNIPVNPAEYLARTENNQISEEVLLGSIAVVVLVIAGVTLTVAVNAAEAVNMLAHVNVMVNITA